jgi:hypothetical protein
MAVVSDHVGRWEIWIDLLGKWLYFYFEIIDYRLFGVIGVISANSMSPKKKKERGAPTLTILGFSSYIAVEDIRKTSYIRG